MSLRLFDFECPVCGTFEEMVEPEIHDLVHECGQTAIRQISGTRIDPRLGLSEAFPTAWNKWEKTRRQHHTQRDPNL